MSVQVPRMTVNWRVACALTALLAFPATAKAVAVALTTVGGDPGVAGDIVTHIPRNSSGVLFFDFHLDIAATTASLAHPANYSDNVSFSSILAYQFVLEAGSGTFFPGPLFASGYTPDPAWLTQSVSGNAQFASWNDFPRSPTGELCDSLDNDCDGTADEDFPSLGNICEVGVGECTAPGTTICTLDGTILLKFTAETGHPHPHLQTAVRNYAGLLEAMGRSDAEVRQELTDVLAEYGLSLD